uniref:Uncharacterized protein n=1 Tax=Ixodes ricinus TaxID=34613 RepID=A0A147BNI8_IXORI
MHFLDSLRRHLCFLLLLRTCIFMCKCRKRYSVPLFFCACLINGVRIWLCGLILKNSFSYFSLINFFLLFTIVCHYKAIR